MGIWSLAKRINSYNRRHGLFPTFRRGLIELKRIIFDNEVILFCLEVSEFKDQEFKLPEGFTAERKYSEEEIDQKDMEVLLSYWNEEIKRQQIEERFKKGAVLWLLKFHGEIVALRWTIRGGTIRPHFFPLTQNDIHEFDGEVFQKFRGKGLYFLFLNYLISQLKKEGNMRVFAEAHSWNRPSLNYFSKTSYKQIGVARKIHVFGKDIVIWSSFPKDEKGNKNISI